MGGDFTGKQDIADHLQSDEFVNEVDKRCYKVAFYMFATWALLTALSYAVYWDHLERLVGLEQKAAMMSCLFIGMTCVTTIIPIVSRGKKRWQSGVLFAAVMVQFVAFLTDFMLAFVPVPVYSHPFSGTRVFLMRWCEWAPLAFVMTFLIECCRLAPSENDSNGKCDSDGVRINNLLSAIRVNNAITPSNHVAEVNDYTLKHGASDYDYLETKHLEKQRKEEIRVKQREIEIRVTEELRPSYLVAWSQGLSTFGGWLFPLLRNVWLLCAAMMISCALFFVILVRTHERGQALKKMKVGMSIAEKEAYKWAKLAFQLQRLCAILWSGLVIAYFCYTFGPLLGPTWTIFQLADMTLIVECFIDVMYKSMYMLIIVDVHDTIFDPKARASRWLEELEAMMSVVWENSSDVICISSKGVNGDVTTILSPTYLKIYSRSATLPVNREDKERMTQKGIVFDLDASVLGNLDSISDAELQKRKIVPTNVYDVEFEKEHTSTVGAINFSENDELASFAQLVTRSWKAKTEGNSLVLMHDLKRMDKDLPQPIQCEAKISVMEENILVIVVRDISERFRRFEAEKKVISETTARRKDVAANRFTRHEVKNGLLAAIGLCDSLNEATGGEAQLEFTREDSLTEIMNHCSDVSSIPATHKHDVHEPNMRTRCIVELGNTLNGVLDTVLTEAMARDVIHEVYEPRIEMVNLSSVLATTMSPSKNQEQKKRFPIVTNPAPLPGFSTDPQLWKYVHRNAVSNACKYGKLGGKVTTEILWDETKGLLTLNVVNLPGDNHAEMSTMGAKANVTIFAPKKRLRAKSFHKSSESSAEYSAGNGAWMMTKCAATLGGECSIQFEEDRTVFSFTCPAKVFDAKEEEMQRKIDSTFVMPENVYGVAIDDSKVQRGIIAKFFNYIGIPNDKIHILGGKNSDITTFEDWAQNFIFNHPNDLYLFIVDENLVIKDEHFSSDTVFSGSKAVSNLRSRLLPHQEKKLLAVIRSANDSTSDIAIYNSRAHGHIPKAPIRADSCLDLIAPLWVARFPRLTRYSSESLFVTGDDEQKKKLSISNMKNASWGAGKQTSQSSLGLTRRSRLDLVRPRSSSGLSHIPSNSSGSSRHDSSHHTIKVNNTSAGRLDSKRINDIDTQKNTFLASSPGLKRPRDNSTTPASLEHKRPRLYSSSQDMPCDDMITIDDLFEHIKELDCFSDLNEEELQLRWKNIWNKLHALKGDLLIIERPSQNVKDVIDLINNLRLSKEKFKENWSKIRRFLLG